MDTTPTSLRPTLKIKLLHFPSLNPSANSTVPIKYFNNIEQYFTTPLNFLNPPQRPFFELCYMPFQIKEENENVFPLY